MKNRNNKKGFTLVEVLVVVLIIGILAAIAVPSYNFTVEKTRAKQGIISLTQIAKAQYTYNAKKGNYSDNMLNLPLDMKDSDGSDATGAEFADKFFDYKIFGDEFERARATRNTGEYELSVEYETGQLFCRPIEHKVCQDLNLEEGEEFISWPQKTDCNPSQYGYSNTQHYCVRTLYKDGTKRDRVCKKTNSACYTYNDAGIKVLHIGNSNGQLDVITYDEITGNLISIYYRNENGNGSEIKYSLYDPVTGKRINYMNTGFINGVAADHEYYSYDDDSGKATSVINFDVNGVPQRGTQWDNSTGTTKIVGKMYYYPSGAMKKYSKYDLNGNLQEIIQYNSDGTIKSYTCTSGPCTEEGYQIPGPVNVEIGLPVPAPYCDNAVDDDVFCESGED